MSQDKLNEIPKPISFAELLQSKPPGVFVTVSNLYRPGSNSGVLGISTPELSLFCESSSCQGLRIFAGASDRDEVDKNERAKFFLNYTCRNCQSMETAKIFAILATPVLDPSALDSHTNFSYAHRNAIVIKLGELPSFVPPTPARVMSLFGPDQDTFLKGRRAENQGLGIGAFAYYRRVVENQKARIIGEIARVARTLGATDQDIQRFDKAKTETQFSRAIDAVKDVIPSVLLIQGHNPLTLLHSALSQGLHELPDEECLEKATTIRLVLAELAERISQALKDETELKQAVSKLLKPKESKPESTSK